MGPRVGAGTYLLCMSLAINGWCLLMIALYKYAIVPNAIDFKYSEYVAWMLATAVGCLFFYLSHRRLQDLNCPGSWSIALAFPLFGVIVLPVLCFLPGQRYSNKFGDPPEPSGVLKIFGALISFAITLVLVPYIARIYAPLHIPVQAG